MITFTILWVCCGLVSAYIMYKLELFDHLSAKHKALIYIGYILLGALGLLFIAIFFIACIAVFWYYVTAYFDKDEIF